MFNERPLRQLLELSVAFVGASSAVLVWTPADQLSGEPAIDIIGVGPLAETLCVVRDREYLAQILCDSVGDFEKITVPARSADQELPTSFLYGKSVDSRWGDRRGALCLLNDKPLKLSLKQRTSLETLAALCKFVTDSNLTANVLHDLRNPISAIIGFSDLVQMREDMPEQRETVKEYNGFIRSCGQTALELTEDLLTLDWAARNENDELKALDLSEFVTRRIAIAKGIARGQEQHIVSKASGVCSISQSSRRLLSRILMNLLNNAIVHNPPGTAIQVKTKLQLGALTLTVSDRPANVGKSAPAKGSPEGYGMGLGIVRALVSQLGGSFSINIRRGAGTLAAVHLPMQAGAENQLPEAAIR